MKLNEEIKQVAIKLGADIVGVAPVSRLTDAPDGFRATDILPSAKSVVVMGIMLPAGLSECWDKSIWSYLYYGYIIPNKRLGNAAFEMAKYLQLLGHQSFPVVPTTYMKDCNVIDPMGEFSHRHAAVAAGLGEFGFSNLMMTPEFGVHNRFVSVITSADIEPDDLYNGPPLCDKCLKCIKICPTQALKKDSPRSVTVAGKTMEYAGLDKLACSYSLLGFPKAAGGMLDIKTPIKDKYSKWDIAWGRVRHFFKNPVVSSVQSEYQSVIDFGDFCGLCMHVCDRPLKKKPFDLKRLVEKRISKDDI